MDVTVPAVITLDTSWWLLARGGWVTFNPHTNPKSLFGQDASPERLSQCTHRSEGAAWHLILDIAPCHEGTDVEG